MSECINDDAAVFLVVCFSELLLSSADFFPKITFFKKIFQKHYRSDKSSAKQYISIQIKTDNVLISKLFLFKGYQQTYDKSRH